MMLDDETKIIGRILGKIFPRRWGHAVGDAQAIGKGSRRPGGLRNRNIVCNGSRRSRRMLGIRKYQPAGGHRGKQHGQGAGIAAEGFGQVFAVHGPAPKGREEIQTNARLQQAGFPVRACQGKKLGRGPFFHDDLRRLVENTVRTAPAGGGPHRPDRPQHTAFVLRRKAPLPSPARNGRRRLPFRGLAAREAITGLQFGTPHYIIYIYFLVKRQPTKNTNIFLMKTHTSLLKSA